MDDAFEAEGLGKRFGDVTALSAVDLVGRRGAILGVLGPNGAGKTTAIRILATLERPDRGRAAVHGLDVVRDAARVRRLIGLAGQYAAVDEDLTGRENLVLFGRLLDMSRTDAVARAGHLLSRFELADAGDRRVSTYSGGMRRRLDLAASMVGRPKVVFMDEPTTGLDPGKRDEVWRMIRAMTHDGGAVLLTTQYLEEADALADDIVVLDHGGVIASGTPAELKQVVGGQTIAVRPSDPGRLEDAAGIIAAVAGRAAERGAQGVVTVPVDIDAQFTEVVHRLEAAGIGVSELSLRLPSLDDAFFVLTGRHTSTHHDEQEDAA